MRNYIVCFLITSILSSVSAFGQKFIRDSMVVSFGSRNYPLIMARIDSVSDQRKLTPSCISLYEKSKFLLPVDFYVLLPVSLGYEIKGMFDSTHVLHDFPVYDIDIQSFELHHHSNLFSNNFTCNALIRLYKRDTLKMLNRKYVGALVYEMQLPEQKSVHLSDGYVIALDSWKSKFYADMQLIISCKDNSTACLPSNLVTGNSDMGKNMFLDGKIAVSNHSWIADGEILFSNPEAQTSYTRQGNNLRYRNESQYQSLEFQISDKQHDQRLNKSLEFLVQTDIFWGINLWNTDVYNKHNLTDILLLDISSNQYLVFNRLYKRGFICGAGIMEDLTEIYSQGLRFKLYGIFQLGLKF